MSLCPCYFGREVPKGRTYASRGCANRGKNYRTHKKGVGPSWRTMNPNWLTIRHTPVKAQARESWWCNAPMDGFTTLAASRKFA